MKTKILILTCLIAFSVSSQTKDLVVIDENVNNIEIVKNALLRPVEFLFINSQSRVWYEIFYALENNSEIEQVHFLVPASEGEIVLEGKYFNEHTISEMVDMELLQGKNVKLLFYGSNMAEVEEGKNLVDKISQLTGLPAAASITTTAGKNTGGDWILEYVSGNFQISVLFSEDLLADYPYNF